MTLERSGSQSDITVDQSLQVESTVVETMEMRLARLGRELYKHSGLSEIEGKGNRPMDFWGGVDVSKVDFTKAIDSNNPQYVQEHEEANVMNGVNDTLANLGYVLGDIGLDALEQYQLDPAMNEEYLSVAETVNALAGALLASADGSISFVRDLEREAKHLAVTSGGGKYDPDPVYYYKTGVCEIDGKIFDDVRFLIRPKDYKRAITSRSGNTIYKRSQSRTKLEIFSKDIPDGEAQLRIDPPHKKMGINKLTFDVQVGSDEQNRIDSLNFEKVGQKKGHHWKSEKSVDNFNLAPFQIHEGIAAKLQALSE